MNPEKSGSPTEILRHLVNSKFHVFLEYERDSNISSSGRVVVALIRSIFSHNPRNIRTALNRLDGVLPRQVNLELPRVYYLYPHAVRKEAREMLIQEVAIQDIVDRQAGEPQKQSRNIPEMTVREATGELGRLPYSLVENILKDAAETAEWFAKKGDSPVPTHTPYLKSVIAAHLVQMAVSSSPDVMEDFFDSVDGRLTETIKVGEDIYLTSYEKEAPEGATLNEQGILMIEATKTQDMWGKALQKGKLIHHE